MKNKKLFAVLTLVCFLFTLMPVAAMAETNVEAQITNASGEVTTSGTLEYVIKNAQSGDTIKVLRDCALTSKVTVSKAITIEADSDKEISLTDNTLSGQDIITVKDGGALTLGKNLTINTVSTVVYVTKGSAVLDGATIVNSSNYATVYATGANSSVEVKNGSSISNGDAASTALSANSGAKITVTNSAISSGEGYAGIYAGGEGSTVTLGENTTVNAVDNAVKAENKGKIIISGADVKSTGSNIEGKPYAAIVSLTGSTVEITSGNITRSYVVDGNNSTLTISGGTFSADPTAYLVDGCSVENNNEKYVVVDNRVAEVSGTKYATLADAIKAANDNNGGTIKVLRDCALTSEVTVSKAITIEADSNKEIALTDNTLSGQDIITVKDGGALTLGKNLTINTVSTVVYVTKGSAVLDGATIVNSSNYATVYATGANSSVEVKNGSSISNGDAASTALSANSGAKITVTNSAISSGEGYAGIYAGGEGSTVTLGENTTVNAVDNAVKAENKGKIIISGADVKSTGSNIEGKPYAAIVSLTGSTVEITSGNITRSYVVDGNNSTLTISGGTFSADPSAYLTEGKCAKFSEGIYTVGAHVHTDELKSDDASHWNECTCGDKANEAAHTYDQQVATDAYKATDATCEVKATYYYSCVCGAKGAETFENGDVVAHAYETKYDANGHWKKCTCGAETEAVAHVYDNASDTTCNDCAYTRTVSPSGSISAPVGGGTISGTSTDAEVTSPNEDVQLTAKAISTSTLNDAKDAVAEDENAAVIGGKDSAVQISAKEDGKVLDSFVQPVTVTVPVNKSALKDVENVNNLTLALVTEDENGETVLTYVGGNYDAQEGTFTAYTNQPGNYVLVEKQDIVKIDMFIGNTTSMINGEAVANDVAAYIANDRTMVPAAFIMDQLGCKVDWFGDERKVVVTLPDGSQLSMIIDQEIPGFGAVPVIKDDRTMVPIAYIADAMGAHVLWVGDEYRVIIVK